MTSLPPVSVQLYSVREQIAADLGGTLSRLAEIGFTAVEPYDLLGDPTALRTLLDSNGLTAPSAHTSVASGRNDLDEVFRAAAEVGVGTVVDPMTDRDRWTTREGVQGVADDLARAAAKGAEYGIKVGYHNHNFELETTIDGRPALEVFAELLDPLVCLELDTWWAAVGGQDVPALLGRLGTRVELIHLKDGPIANDKSRQQALGKGDMPVAEIVAAATSLRITVLEFDEYAGDLFEGLATGLAFARGLELAR